VPRSTWPVGYHELYVNGKRIGDGLPGHKHRKRARYVTYEIADQLQQGKNVIALWLGVSWSIFPPYKTDDRPQTPIVLAQADIHLSGGGITRIATDDSWRTHPSPNTLMGVWDFMHFGGERYDASKEVPGWAEVGFDDSKWESAMVYAPNLVLSAEMIEPNRQIKAVQPVAVEEPKPNVYRVDLGVNVTGWLEADVRGRPGDEIEFKFSERPSTDMTHRLHSKYVIGPAGKGTFRNRFNYFTGRWVTIEGLKYKPALSDIRAPRADRLCAGRRFRVLERPVEPDLPHDPMDLRGLEPRWLRGRLPAPRADGLRRRRPRDDRVRLEQLQSRGVLYEVEPGLARRPGRRCCVGHGRERGSQGLG
jgi:alpha-L-rhamnosidase